MGPSSLRTHAVSPLVQKILIVTYITTGIIQPLLMDEIKIFGAASQWSFLYSLPHAIGMAFMLLRPIKDKSFNTSLWDDLKEFKWPILLVSLVDVFASTIVIFGQLMVGSAMYTIIYSSVPVWAAIGSRVLVGRKLTQQQWLYIGTVVAGLGISGAGALNEPGDRMLAGCVVTLIGTILHSGIYFIAEAVLRRPDQRPLHPQRYCGLVGLFDVLWLSLYVLIYTVPRWQELVTDPITEAGSHYTAIWLLYLMLTVDDSVHSGSFYPMLGVVGSVSMAVFKTVASVGVFLGSALFFCSIDQTECLTGYKIASLVVVIIGVVGYSVKTDSIHRLATQAALARTEDVSELVSVRERHSLLEGEATESEECEEL
ncbi:hypothetical protein KIPB_000052 [Kipferlia bialata]|uniref:Sugar phosphate transporter domain-containing protein n=1 Tax=Kipferlia bialata TaxID=797122 RepID=A0A9K3GE77_9EUKA|nr:hypothetical protein KIPB_000052 [Kipferlia bialata]|eukprot:g52.t1